MNRKPELKVDVEPTGLTYLVYNKVGKSVLPNLFANAKFDCQTSLPKKVAKQ